MYALLILCYILREADGETGLGIRARSVQPYARYFQGRCANIKESMGSGLVEVHYSVVAKEDIYLTVVCLPLLCSCVSS